MTGVYMVFSLVFLLVIFVLVLGYALEVSGLMKDKQEKTFAMLMAHRIGNSFDVSRRNGVATTSLISSDALLFGMKKMRIDVSGAQGSILVNSTVKVKLSTIKEFKLEKHDSFYLLEVFD
jgi:hypothetical protein